jgi:thymidylate synthase
LSARERTALKSNGSTRLYDSIKEENYQTVDADDVMHAVCNEYNVPKRAISLMWNQRSVDTGLGLGFNIASYGLLLEIFAKEVNMVPDELIGNLGDVHLYLDHVEPIKEQLTREPFQLPKLKIKQHSIDEPSPLTKPQYWHPDDFVVENYQSHPTIKLPLSN